MDLEFDGISVARLKDICDKMQVSANIYPSKRHGPVCTRERGYYSSPSSTGTDDACMYYCWGYNCGTTNSSCGSSRRRRQTSNCDCNGSSGSSDCGGGDAGEAIAILFLIIIVVAIIFLIIAFLPDIIVGITLVFDATLAFFAALFDIITFGVFRSRFYRTTIEFPSGLSQEQEKEFVYHAVNDGGVPKNYQEDFGTIGFGVFRIGAYLFIPTLILTFLVLYLNPASRTLKWSPIIAFIFSLFCLFLGTLIIRNKKESILSLIN